MKDEDWMFDTVEIWAIALTDLRITGKELATAQRKSMALDWPPTAPADFLALARTDTTANYPDTRAAYRDAAHNRYPHAVIYETARRVGFWELKTKSEAVTYKSWQQHYPQVCREHSEGNDFALPVEQQLEYSHTPLKADSPVAAKVDDFLSQFLKKRESA